MHRFWLAAILAAVIAGCSSTPHSNEVESVGAAEADPTPIMTLTGEGRYVRRTDGVEMLVSAACFFHPTGALAGGFDGKLRLSVSGAPGIGSMPHNVELIGITSENELMEAKLTAYNGVGHILTFTGWYYVKWGMVNTEFEQPATLWISFLLADGETTEPVFVPLS